MSRGKWRYYWGVVFLVGLLFGADCRAQDPKYLVEVPTKRLALVVANSNYELQEKLPGTPADRKAVHDILEQSGFKVRGAEDVSRAEFLNLHLLPFISEINEGDFVVFYFSGHGFNYGGENYLVPLQFPATVPADKVFVTFISLTSIMDLIAERNPGFVFLVLDACRNFPNFITAARPELAMRKGAAELRSLSGNFVIGFSSDLGKTSIGSSEAGKLSVYTAALTKFLAKEDTDLDTVEKEVHADVLIETQEQQKPWFSQASSVEIRFRPSQDRQKDEDTIWRSVLKTDEEKQVRRFLIRYSISRFAKAARNWLDDFRVRPRGGFTRISPLAPELSWAAASEASEPQTIKLTRIEGPLAFPRDPQKQGSMERVALSDVTTVREIRGARVASPAMTATPRPAFVFAKHGEAVLTGPVSARDRPDENAKVVTTLPAGTKLVVHGAETDRKNATWARVSAPGLDQTVFVSVSSTTVTRTVDIGKPLLELKVGGLAGGLQSLVDAKTITDALQTLGDKKRIQWVSIVTPKTEEKNTADILGLRAAHVRYILDQAGVASQRTSIVEGATDLSGAGIESPILWQLRRCWHDYV